MIATEVETERRDMQEGRKRCESCWAGNWTRFLSHRICTDPSARRSGLLSLVLYFRWGCVLLKHRRLFLLRLRFQTTSFERPDIHRHDMYMTIV
jgi:hypothetical protein